MSKLNLFEKCLKTVGGFFLAPFGFKNVKVNTTMSVYRFGKYDRDFQNGLRWIAPLGYRYEIFQGVIAKKSDNLHLIDSEGNPIIIKSITTYKITNPKLYIEATDFFNRENIIDYKIEMCLRHTLSKYPFISPDKVDIRSISFKVREDLIEEVGLTLASDGINVQDVQINEARFSPEIESLMLVKQQAAAYIEARELIVQGAIDTVKDAAFQMSGELKEEYRQQLVVNLLTVLSGNSHVQPTIKL